MLEIKIYFFVIRPGLILSGITQIISDLQIKKKITPSNWLLPIFCKFHLISILRLQRYEFILIFTKNLS